MYSAKVNVPLMCTLYVLIIAGSVLAMESVQEMPRAGFQDPRTSQALLTRLLRLENDRKRSEIPNSADWKLSTLRAGGAAKLKRDDMGHSRMYNMVLPLLSLKSSGDLAGLTHRAGLEQAYRKLEELG